MKSVFTPPMSIHPRFDLIPYRAGPATSQLPVKDADTVLQNNVSEHVGERLAKITGLKRVTLYKAMLSFIAEKHN